MQPGHDSRPLEAATIHLRLAGEPLVVETAVPAGTCRAVEILPFVRAISEAATAVATGRSETAGKTVACRAACGACCRQLVAISPIEAVLLSQLVETMPDDRKRRVRARFDGALHVLERTGMLDARGTRGRRQLKMADQGNRWRTIQAAGRRYFALGIACPFLENESCSIHPERPVVCREYHVTSAPERCANLYEVGVDKVESPLHLGDAMAKASTGVFGIESGTIPLVLALEQGECLKPLLDRPVDGPTLARAILAEIDPRHDRRFEDRGEPDETGQ